LHLSTKGISQSSVATHLGRGRIVINDFTANLMLRLKMKNENWSGFGEVTSREYSDTFSRQWSGFTFRKRDS